jgi:hypothetical protein
VEFGFRRPRDGVSDSLHSPNQSPNIPLRQFVVQQDRDRSSLEAIDRDACTDQMSGEHIEGLHIPLMRSKLGHASSRDNSDTEARKREAADARLLTKKASENLRNGRESDNGDERGANSSFLSHSNLFPQPVANQTPAAAPGAAQASSP